MVRTLVAGTPTTLAGFGRADDERSTGPRPPYRPSGVELVAQPAHGDQVARRCRVGLDLRPETLHVDVQGLGVADVVRSPHPVDQLPAGQHPAGVAQEHLE